MADDGLNRFGEALGLHPDFIRDVALRGQTAIIDRTDMIDGNGAQGRMLAMVQQVGMALQQRMPREKAPKEGEIMDTIVFFADRYRVPHDSALHLVGAVREAFQQTARRVAKGATGSKEASPKRAE